MAISVRPIDMPSCNISAMPVSGPSVLTNAPQMAIQLINRYARIDHGEVAIKD